MGQAMEVVRRKFRTGLHLLLRNRRALRSLWSFEPYVVFSAQADSITVGRAPEDVEVRHIGATELDGLLDLDDEIRDAAHYCHSLRDEAVFGAFVNGRLAHVSWFITADLDRLRLPPRLVGLRQGEAEITHCVTLPEFRGRGLYPYVIAYLFEMARDRGVRRLFMITRANNASSQHGIVKAGLSRCRGHIYCLRILRNCFFLRTFRLAW